MNHSRLSATLEKIAAQTGAGIVGMMRPNNQALNKHTLKSLSTPPGHPGSLIADPIIEVAQDWKEAGQSFGEMAGSLLEPRLVDALDTASAERMPRERKPYAHQVAAWTASGEGRSVLVSSGTGSGKTECFMIPILNDILRNPAPGAGIRAIIVYPLNALIQSQRERLKAWAEGLGGDVTYALYNGDTPERATLTGPTGEVMDRRTLRARPPSILVANTTMLEYMLLRAEDQGILEKSKGLLRWIVLDEAHSYVGAQASEMAMLLRRVRSAFGVSPEDVRLMATSATIEGDDLPDAPDAPLNMFMQGLSGRSADGITVIKGQAVEAPLPPAGADTPLAMAPLLALGDELARWQALAPHPRLQSLRGQLKAGMTLGQIALHCFGHADARPEAEQLLDMLAQATETEGGRPFLRWRGHLFLRALAGAWSCLDPDCPHKSMHLGTAEDWPFGQVHFTRRERCTCGAPAMEIRICDDCGTPYLKAMQDFGARHRLILGNNNTEDDFSTDVEPDPDAADQNLTADDLWVATVAGAGRPAWVHRETLDICSDLQDDSSGYLALPTIDTHAGRPVCDCVEKAKPLRRYAFSPAYLIGQNMQIMLEAFSPPDGAPALKPLLGKGAISFTDSRQGVARLAAKMQAEGERNLTRAFIAHAVNGERSDAGRIAKIQQLEIVIAAMGENAPPAIRDDLEDLRQQEAAPASLPWTTAINDLAAHPELRLHISKVWHDRDPVFQQQDGVALASVLLHRELIRRPVRQNNAETMGMARLAFPKLENATLKQPLPPALLGRGVTAEDYLGLVLSVVDFFFRERLVIALEQRNHLEWIAPKWGRLSTAVNNDITEAERGDSLVMPSAQKGTFRLNRLARNALTLLGGSPDNDADMDDATDLLNTVFKHIAQHAGKPMGMGAWALDLNKAEIQAYDKAWLCPVSRRVFGYSIRGRSPVNGQDLMTPLVMPRMPLFAPGGVTEEERKNLAAWLETDPNVAGLRAVGVWSNLHDRAVLYPGYMRAQEHSAQLPRSLLQVYEKDFNEGHINLLTCSTTMEMGVDLANVGLVVNSNVPPSVSNYRQRVGRAGRRREPWAFGATWCRDLPLDMQIFEDPKRLLQARMSAPKVTLSSTSLMQRHVNAAALSHWLRHQGGIRITEKAGSFFGMDLDGKAQPDSSVDRFLNALATLPPDACLPDAASLLRGSCLSDRSTGALVSAVAQHMGVIVKKWRQEFRVLVLRAKGTAEGDVRKALDARAKNMFDAFLLAELATSGFTPAYGFPSDVVTFEYIGMRRGQGEGRPIDSGRDGASRPLDVALREYAPGADLVINGLVYTSEGIRPAWSVNAAASSLEDMRTLTTCQDCGRPHLKRDAPEACESCGSDMSGARLISTLRPVGFVGKSKPHIGYELLQPSRFTMPEITAEPAPWEPMKAEGWRQRATGEGQVITLGSGEAGEGYTLCLICGRAHDEAETVGAVRAPVATSMINHRALVTGSAEVTAKGICTGGTNKGTLKRNVHFVHDRLTDVYELQLPKSSSEAAAFAVAAGLREALTQWHGIEAAEVGIATGQSKGADLSRRVSAYLYDNAAGGAGLSSRLIETGQLARMLPAAIRVLDCPDDCANGCPRCILRPDMNMARMLPDRAAALRLLRELRTAVSLDKLQQIFGDSSAVVTKPLFEVLNQAINQQTASSLTLFVHGTVADWHFSEWGVLEALAVWRLKLPVTIVLPKSAVHDPALSVAARLQLFSLAGPDGLETMEVPPMQVNRPVLACWQTETGLQAVAATTRAESLPDANWGAGQTGALITGQIAALPQWSTEPLSAFMPQGAPGGTVSSALDNRYRAPMPRFGQVFWKALEEDAGAIVGRLFSEGVAEICYRDRYFRRAYHFAALKYLVEAMPGRDAKTQLRVTTTTHEPTSPPRMLEHMIATDEQREDLFAELFPGDRFLIEPKANTDHARQMHITTHTGTKITIWFDQGLDLWKPGAPSSLSGQSVVGLARELVQSQSVLTLRNPDATAPLFALLS